MSSYQGTTPVSADAKSVFDFVTNLENLPKYVPTVAAADTGCGDVIHMSGACPHGAYRGVGGFHTDEEHLRMHWDSRANLNYRGWLQVFDKGDHSEVIIHLEFDPGLEQSTNKEFVHVLREHPSAIQLALDETLQRIKSHCEALMPA